MQVKLTTVGRDTHARLSGDLDEGAEKALADLEKQVASSASIVFNLGGIRHVNSLGARHWAQFLAKATAHGAQVELSECGCDFVDSLNLVRQMAENAIVQSFYAPFYCAKCRQDAMVLVEAKAADPAKPPPSPACSTCKESMALEVTWTEYLRFLSY